MTTGVDPLTLLKAQAAGYIQRCAGDGCRKYVRASDRFCASCLRSSRRDVAIYFMGVPRLGNVVKIGQTTDLNKRLDSIATGCPYPPELLASVRADVDLERALHAHFGQYRTHLEWFRLSAPIKRVIELARSGHLQEAIDEGFALADSSLTRFVRGQVYGGTKIHRLREEAIPFPSVAELIKLAKKLARRQKPEARAQAA